jgi:hypothetical protein
MSGLLTGSNANEETSPASTGSRRGTFADDRAAAAGSAAAVSRRPAPSGRDNLAEFAVVATAVIANTANRIPANAMTRVVRLILLF